MGSAWLTANLHVGEIVRLRVVVPPEDDPERQADTAVYTGQVVMADAWGLRVTLYQDTEGPCAPLDSWDTCLPWSGVVGLWVLRDGARFQAVRRPEEADGRHRNH